MEVASQRHGRTFVTATIEQLARAVGHLVHPPLRYHCEAEEMGRATLSLERALPYYRYHGMHL
jgi:hypothetical protein